jgi:hypothetical protein
MLRKIIFVVFVVFSLTRCGELQQIASQLPQTGNLGNADIAAALRQALNEGIERQVTSLMKDGGFYNQPDVRILLPDELQKVDKKLRQIGLGSLADKGIKLLNRAAEEAVKEAKPVFVKAVKEITFDDARKILMGDQTAATEYLKNKTRDELYRKFYPIVQNSFKKVGADEIWTKIISRYNQIPFVNKVNPDLNDYVTRKALEGVYKKIADEEKRIRTDINARTTELMKKVFALQDK